MKKLCITSGGKGGTGKSTIACLLAYALSQEGFSVLLLDLGGGDSGLLCLGRIPTRENSSGEIGLLLENLQESPFSSSLYVASIPPSPSNTLPSDLQHLHAAQPDIVVIDSEPRSSYGSNTPLDLYIFVALPNWLSWNAYQRWLRGPGAQARRDDLLLVLNMYQSLLIDWRRRYSAAAEYLAVLSYDPALAFVYTRNIAEAFLALGRRTRKDLQDILGKLTTLLEEAHSREA